ncbi:family 43 glycosylhydrolase [Celerinatantimonas sp. MCCC 1A17872]|uniref:family 43 glycosylhydrolase n=1 Tax=Celerinatantimonas sp. MCCC 1A17872 TaxID=3177514 RepID=UPI0038C01795
MMNHLFKRFVIIFSLALLLSPLSYAAKTLTNPIYENGADPWVEYYDGNYYAATTTWSSQLLMRKSATLAGLADAKPVTVWSETDSSRCCNFWAFEFHRLKGPNGWRWYMMFTSGVSANYDHQHLSVLESVGDDPMGPYQYKGSMMPDSWNIDGSYLSYHGKLYLLYSQWVDDEQRDFIAQMSNPWTLSSAASLLTRPALPWERVGMNVNEGPEALVHNGRVFITYSASYCETPDYKLGLLELTGKNPLNPDDWTKYPDPVFTKANGVYGPGHNGFFKSPDGSQYWLTYHGNASADDGCSTKRALRAQPFTFASNGLPVFGQPVASGSAIAVPSGENGPMKIHPTGVSVTLTIADNQKTTLQGTLDPLPNNLYRLVNQAGLTLTNTQCGHGLWQQWQNTNCQRWQLSANSDGSYQLINAQTQTPLTSKCAQKQCQNWQLSFTTPIAIVNGDSGRLITYSDGALIQQAWDNLKSQKWIVKSLKSGAMKIENGATGQCLTYTNSRFYLSRCNKNANQWQLITSTKGGFAIKNITDDKLLTQADCSLGDGEAITLETSLDSLCQRFYLRNIK